jgi:hypothetical protein
LNIHRVVENTLNQKNNNSLSRFNRDDIAYLQMITQEKQLSNPFSTGGGGVIFETYVQATFIVLMLTSGFAPCLPSWPIKKIKLQGKYAGYNIDDCIVFTQEPNSNREAKLLAQIKHYVSITEGDNVFGEVINAAWNDFCNPLLFCPDRDAFALITGPLSASDIENARTILEWSRHSENASEFITNVQKAQFSSDQKRSKLKAFRFHLEKAKSSDVTDDELWRFMKGFHLLGYDLDIKMGVTLSLLQSLIGYYSSENAQKLWLQIVEEVQDANQHAGTLSIDSLSLDIRNAFKKPEIQIIPEGFVKKAEIEVQADFTSNQYASELALATLLGAWDESSDNDKRAVEKLSDNSFGEWIVKMRSILSQSESPLTIKNGKWKITKRLELWNTLSSRIFDDHLDRFKEIAVNVLREHDPKFELPKEERFAARVHGKVLLHSQLLRNALAEGLTILGSHPKALTSCSLHKPEVTVAFAIRELLDGEDWVIWASLNDILPLLAEADPNEFLNAVEKILNDKNNKTFLTLFAQEGSGIGGWNYITGILWALETLAWHQDYLARVTVLLGQLAECDPGGNWANRPINSLTTIFLPWLPQTTAEIGKRRIAVEALIRECPTIGWKLLLTLLPNTHQVTSGSRKPVWREFIPKDLLDKLSGLDSKVSRKDYFEQVNIYADLAFQNAKSDLKRLIELIKQLDDLPNPVYSQLIAHVSSKEIVDMPESERVVLWETLTDIVIKHRKFSDAHWALPTTEVEKITSVTDMLKPSLPNLVYRRLFGQHEAQLYDEKGNYEEQRKKIEDQRTKAIKEILMTFGIEGVIDFARSVTFPLEVGLALGRISNIDQDSYFVPNKLTVDEKVLKDVTFGYVWSRFNNKGWEWVNRIEIGHWADEQKAAFLVLLPFTRETWQRAKTQLGQNESMYWKQADAKPYQLKEELQEAVEKLLQNKRPRAAIQCLSWMLYEKMEISLEYAYQALLSNLVSEEPTYSLDQHDTTELIKWLQVNPGADVQILSKIEWIYLRLLDHHFGLAPVTLEHKLANDPSFFCEVIRTVFRSDKQEDIPEEISEGRKQIATHAYELLFNWQTPPGSKSDGSFNVSELNKWIDEVKHSCED